MPGWMLFLDRLPTTGTQKVLKTLRPAGVRRWKQAMETLSQRDDSWINHSQA